MKCNFSIEDIIRYTENQMADDEKEKVRKHLDSCESCRRHYGVLTYTEDCAKTEVPGGNISKKVMGAIDTKRYKSKQLRFKRMFYNIMPIIKPALACVAVLAIVVGVVKFGNLSGLGGGNNVTLQPGASIEPEMTVPVNFYEMCLSKATDQSQIDRLNDLMKVDPWEHKREALMIINELPKDQARLTLEQAKKIIENSNGYEDVIKAFNEIAGAPDWEGGSGIWRACYYLDHDDLHTKAIVVYDQMGIKYEEYDTEGNRIVSKSLDDVDSAIGGDATEEVSQKALDAIKNERIDELARLVHPTKGVVI